MIVSVLPSAEEIHAAIPEQGIGSRVIAFKFMSYLDETNTELFFKLLKAVSFRESETRIRPVPRLPSSEELEAILSSTLPEAPAAKEEKCRFKRTSRHISGMTMYVIFNRLECFLTDINQHVFQGG